MRTGMVTRICPDDDYRIILNTLDPIPLGCLIKQIKELGSNGELVTIGGKQKWRATDSFKYKAGGSDTVVKDAICRISGQLKYIQESLPAEDISLMQRKKSAHVSSDQIITCWLI
jgi:hypothetical protein